MSPLGTKNKIAILKFVFDFFLVHQYGRTMNLTTLKTWVFVFIILRTFIEGTEEFFIVPTAWQYIKSLGKTESFLAGVLASFDITVVLFSPIFGRLHDRFGHTKFIIVFGCFVKLVANVLYSIPFSAYCPLLGRTLSGVAGATMGILYTILTLNAPARFRAQVVVVVDEMFIIGAIGGPFISSTLTFKLDIQGWHINSGNAPSFVLAIVFFALFVVALWLPNDLGDVLSDELRKDPCSQQVDFASKSTILCVLVQIFSSAFLVVVFLFYLPLFTQELFHLQLIHVKLLLCVGAGMAVIAQGVVFIAAGHISERTLMIFSFPSQIIMLGFVAFISVSWKALSIDNAYMLLAMCILAPHGFAFALCCSIMLKITNPSHSTFYQGLCFSASHIGFVAGRIISGFLFTETSLFYYSVVLALWWIAGVLWFGAEYQNMDKNKWRYNSINGTP